MWSRCYGKWLLMKVVGDLRVGMVIVGVVGRVGVVVVMVLECKVILWVLVLMVGREVVEVM